MVPIIMAEAMSGCQDPLVRDEGPPAGLVALGLQGNRKSSGTAVSLAHGCFHLWDLSPTPPAWYLDSDMPRCPLLGRGIS